MPQIASAKENRKKRQAKMDACMKKAKTKKQKLNCKRLHTNIFDPISKEQQAKQDSTLKSFFQKKP
jgi:hypothetical protein|tara:strand:+ start:365 stop:562 length:198 start_codon:yes stop_codon:yes gene_type:complete